ncbi:MAG: YwaF family protein [Candidatus Izimaplasma sp.]|nr:YwaF family protein [Candidatus Izimaplasma bacterium]
MTLSNFFTTIGMDEQPSSYFFSNYHLVYLLVNILFFILLFKFLKNKPIKFQNKIISISLVIILLLKFTGEALFIYEYYFIDNVYSSYPHAFFDVNTFFSFQLCGIMNILLPLVIWFNIKPLKDFVFATSILGGLAVIFYPVTVLYGSPYQITFPIIRSSIIHFFLIFIPLFLIYRGDFKFKKENWTKVAIGLLLTAGWAMIGNLFIDTTANNMYLMSNPFNGGPIPLINILSNGYHVLFLAIAVTLGYIIVYQISYLFEPKIYKRKLKYKK